MMNKPKLNDNIFNIVFGVICIIMGITIIKGSGYTRGMFSDFIHLNDQQALLIASIIFFFSFIFIVRGLWGLYNLKKTK